MKPLFLGFDLDNVDFTCTMCFAHFTENFYKSKLYVGLNARNLISILWDLIAQSNFINRFLGIKYNQNFSGIMKLCKFGFISVSSFH